jgi:hypothetical protein
VSLDAAKLRYCAGMSTVADSGMLFKHIKLDDVFHFPRLFQVYRRAHLPFPMAESCNIVQFWPVVMTTSSRTGSGSACYCAMQSTLQVGKFSVLPRGLNQASGSARAADDCQTQCKMVDALGMLVL